MKGVRFLGSRKLKVDDFPDPEPGPGQIVVAMKVAAICGSDLHRYRAQDPGPTIPGHEPCGVVAAVGHGVERLKVGDRVMVYHIDGCGLCSYCRKGYPMYCKEMEGYGGNVHGSDADYVIASERNAIPLRDDFSFVEGAFLACNAGTTWQAALELELSADDTAVIYGLGPVGQCGVLVAKAMGARVIAVDTVGERRELAQELGADEVLDGSGDDVVGSVKKLTGGEGAQTAFDFTGVPVARQNALDSVRPFGRVGLMGVPWAREVSYKGHGYITVTSSWIYPWSSCDELMDFFTRYRLPVDKMVSECVPIADAERAFEVYDRYETAGKIVFEWE